VRQLFLLQALQLFWPQVQLPSSMQVQLPFWRERQPQGKRLS